VKNLCPYPLEIIFFSRGDKGVLNWLSCEKFLCKISVHNIPLEKISFADKGDLKMAALPNISVKNLRPYPAEIFRVPTNGVLKWLNCEKFLWKTSVSIIHPRIFFIVPIKGLLKCLSCEKALWKPSVPIIPLEFFSRADKGGAKMTELREISVKNICPYIISLEKIFSCR